MMFFFTSLSRCLPPRKLYFSRRSWKSVMKNIFLVSVLKQNASSVGRQHFYLVGHNHISSDCSREFTLFSKSLDKNTTMFWWVTQTYFCPTQWHALHFLAIELLIENGMPGKSKCLSSPWEPYKSPFFLWNNNHCNTVGEFNIFLWGMSALLEVKCDFQTNSAPLITLCTFRKSTVWIKNERSLKWWILLPSLFVLCCMVGFSQFVFLDFPSCGSPPTLSIWLSLCQ